MYTIRNCLELSSLAGHLSDLYYDNKFNLFSLGFLYIVGMLVCLLKSVSPSEVCELALSLQAHAMAGKVSSMWNLHPLRGVFWYVNLPIPT